MDRILPAYWVKDWTCLGTVLSSTAKQKFHCPLPNTVVFFKVLIKMEDAPVVASRLLLHKVQKYNHEGTHHSTYQPYTGFFLQKNPTAQLFMALV